MIRGLSIGLATLYGVAAIAAGAPTQTKVEVGLWEIHCNVDEVMDRKSCVMLSLRPYTAMLQFGPVLGFTLYGAEDMRPTRAAVRVDAEPGMETRNCEHNGCRFTRSQSIELAGQALKGRSLLIVVESPQADQRYEQDLSDFPAALAVLRQENAGIPLLEPSKPTVPPKSALPRKPNV